MNPTARRPEAGLATAARRLLRACAVVALAAGAAACASGTPPAPRPLDVAFAERFAQPPIPSSDEIRDHGARRVLPEVPLERVLHAATVVGMQRGVVVRGGPREGHEVLLVANTSPVAILVQQTDEVEVFVYAFGQGASAPDAETPITARPHLMSDGERAAAGLFLDQIATQAYADRKWPFLRGG